MNFINNNQENQDQEEQINQIHQPIKNNKYYFKKFGMPVLLCAIVILVILGISLIVKHIGG